MNARVNEINREIEELKNQLQNAQGSSTEVYARIVGYYRSVKNWNRGKKQEYSERTPFSRLEKEEKETEMLVEEISPLTDKPVKPGSMVSSDSIGGFTYFYRTSCPNCPAMKNVLDQLSLEGEHINVDMERGLEAASENLVFSAPTVIFKSAEGQELFRTGHPQDVMDLFKLTSATA